MHTEDLNNILHALMCQAYDIEKQMIDTLPAMEKYATDPTLANIFAKHLAETKVQLTRLEQAHKMLDMDIKSMSEKAATMLIEEGETLFKGAKEGPVRDAALIIAAQRVEHLEIANYGSMVALARTLGHNQVADLLEITLKEEHSADDTLNVLANNQINIEAVRAKAA